VRGIEDRHYSFIDFGQHFTGLSSATVARNSELEAQVVYLQQQLAALKNTQAKLGLLGESLNDVSDVQYYCYP
jgi:hypothetical protein